MAEQILTLCDSCKSELEIGGFRMTKIHGSTTTEKKKSCEQCGQRKGTCKQYIVSVKRKGVSS